ncbi:MAG: hypothetical protein AABW58_00915 [Nanoarchaeota archaeon]
MIKEFEHYLDFWLQGQRKGFAGDLPRTRLEDGSKIVFLRKHPLLYVDRWYGSDSGGGQTILYKSIGMQDSESPLKIIEGTPTSVIPIARLGYSGEIVRRFTEEEMEKLRKTFGDTSQSDIIWRVLKAALSKVERERPLRGPGQVIFIEFPGFKYISEEKHSGDNRIIGEEIISFAGNSCFSGNYDFALIKKNLEDKLN